MDPYCDGMTLAATRRYGLALSGVIGVLAAIVAAALIATVASSPERVLLATNQGELSSLLRLVYDQLSTMAGALLRLMF